MFVFNKMYIFADLNLNLFMTPDTNSTHSTKKCIAEFDSLYKQYFPRLVAYAAMFLPQEEATDAVQEVFVHLWESTSLDVKQSTIKSYLFTSVKNKCLDIIRRDTIKTQYQSEAGRYMLDKELASITSGTNDIEKEIFSKELEGSLNEAIASLSPKCREVFLLSFQEELSAKEIAAQLSISQSTAENHIYNAFKTLRQKLSRYAQIFAWLTPPFV